MGTTLERFYQKQLIKELNDIFEGKAIIIKNDSSYLQGIPDWAIMYGKLCILLEVKSSEKAITQPNQEYYLSKHIEMGGYGYLIYPENEEEVMGEIRALKDIHDAIQ